MTWLVAVGGGMFALGGLAALVRVVLGPTHLDRVVAADVLTATLVCWLGLRMVTTGDTSLMPVLLALALFAIVGSVSVARFLSRPEDEG